jgi:hypothetical protein
MATDSVRLDLSAAEQAAVAEALQRDLSVPGADHEALRGVLARLAEAGDGEFSLLREMARDDPTLHRIRDGVYRASKPVEREF